LQTKIIIPKILQNLQQKKVFIEPFVGGGAIIIELLKQCYLNNINNVTFYCSDINNIIIEMYNQIKNNPKKLIENLIELKTKIMKKIIIELEKNIIIVLMYLSSYILIKLASEDYIELTETIISIHHTVKGKIPQYLLNRISLNSQNYFSISMLNLIIMTSLN